MYQAWPWNGKEVQYEATAWWWQNGREGEENIAMHCIEINEVRSA